MIRSSTRAVPRLALAAAVIGVIGVSGSVGGPAAAATGSCGGWSLRTVALGLGSLENLTSDGAGGFYVSATDSSAVVRVAADGSRTTVVAGVDTPGGLVLRGSTLWFVTGDSSLNTVLGLPGHLEKVDVTTGAHAVVATVTAPNGLLGLPDGSLVVSSSALPGLAGMQRVDPATAAVQKRWSPRAHTNGLGLSPGSSVLYTDDPYTGDVLAVPLGTSSAGASTAGTTAKVANIGTPLDVVDDLAVGSSGTLYVARNSGGKVERVDPATGAHCTIAATPNPSSVRIAPGAHGPALFLSSFDGTLRELTPPPGTGTGL